MGFGWCYDDGLWGSYLTATQQYIDFCSANGYSTKIFFTTGPVDDYMATGENGYNNYLRWEHIRDYVDEDASRILFDYADILSYNNDGMLSTETWNSHTFPVIHPDNEEGTYTGHIGSAGAIRLAKAMWWMLARIAGWDGIVTATEMPEASTIEESVVSVDMNSDKITVIVADQYLNGQVSLYNSNGQLIYSRKILKNIIYLSTSLLSSGLYLVVLFGNNRREVKKIIIKQ